MRKGRAKKKEIRMAVPVETREGLSSAVSNHFGMSPYFLICDLVNGKIKEWEFVSNPGADEEVRMGLVAARFLIDQGVNAVLVASMGDGPYWMLKSNSVRMYKILQIPGSEEEFKKCLEGYEGLPEIVRE